MLEGAALAPLVLAAFGRFTRGSEGGSCGTEGRMPSRSRKRASFDRTTAVTIPPALVFFSGAGILLPRDLTMKQPATPWVVRRLERLLAEAHQALEQAGAREELHRQMLQLGRQIDAAYRQLESREPAKAEIRALRQQQEQIQQQIEALRKQADGALNRIRDWHQRVRQTVLEAAAQHSSLLPMARELARMRAPRERGAQALRLEIVEARSQLEAALGQFLPKMPEMPEMPAEPAKPAKALLTVREAAALLAVSDKTLYRMVRLGQVPHVRVGRSLRFRCEELETWIRQQSIRPRRVR